MHLAVPGEDDVDLRRAARRGGANRLGAEDSREGVLQRLRQRRRGLLHRQLAGARDDADAMESHLRKDRRRHRRRRVQPGRDEQRRDPQNGDAIGFDEAAEAHAASHRSNDDRGGVGQSVLSADEHELAGRKAVEDLHRLRPSPGRRARGAARRGRPRRRERTADPSTGGASNADGGISSASRWVAPNRRTRTAAPSSGCGSGEARAMRTGTVSACGVTALRTASTLPSTRIVAERDLGSACPRSDAARHRSAPAPARAASAGRTSRRERRRRRPARPGCAGGSRPRRRRAPPARCRGGEPLSESRAATRLSSPFSLPACSSTPKPLRAASFSSGRTRATICPLRTRSPVWTSRRVDTARHRRSEAQRVERERLTGNLERHGDVAAAHGDGAHLHGCDDGNLLRLGFLRARGENRDQRRASRRGARIIRTAPRI